MSTINADAAVEPAAARPSARPAYGIAAGAALALFVLTFGTWAPESPEVGQAGAAEIRAWASEAASTLQMNAFAGALGLVALIVLTGALARLARRFLPESSLREAILLGGGLLVAINAVVTGLPLLWVLSDVSSLSDTVVQTWYSLSWFGQMLGEISIVAQSVLLAAFSIAALRGRIIGRWISWLGIVLAATGLISVVGLVVPSTVFDTAWLAALYGWTLWLLLVSIVLGIRRLRG
ncbi:hypothetical protein [Planotetraspora kaengkrachanensis]|uniref:DUF4386 family protein n=1 Tax=Planotetraspora kaengkrachanensis TaxID=575193 RepID=A0A8J3VB85_9ACTN|nr:hypothetical protein [Planotetraspora kaengkrachanensis]GIG83801.1 hypothetical protein Pka01_69280 [Planotetraspora kaengkrachanensis]